MQGMVTTCHRNNSQLPNPNTKTRLKQVSTLSLVVNLPLSLDSNSSSVSFNQMALISSRPSIFRPGTVSPLHVKSEQRSSLHLSWKNMVESLEFLLPPSSPSLVFSSNNWQRTGKYISLVVVSTVLRLV